MRAPTLPAPGKSDTGTFSIESKIVPAAIPDHNRSGVLRLDLFESVAAALLLLLITAFHVRFVTNVGGLWRDEANSVTLANLPSFAEMWGLLDYDSFPMLFFAVLRGWTALFGADDDLALRVLGLITGLGILGAAWASARSFGIKWPVLSLALIGLNPMFIRYGDSTRAYGLGILLMLLTLRSFWRLVDSTGPPGRRRMFEATLLALLSVQCLYYNSVLLLAIAAGAMAVAIRSRAWHTFYMILGIGMLAAASLLPYIPMMRRMREWTFVVTYPDGGFPWLWTRLCEVLGSPSRLGVWLWSGLVISGLLIAAGVSAVNRLKPERSPGGIPSAVLFATVTLAVGFTGYAGFLRVLNYWTQPWYYITLVAFTACLLEVLFGAWPTTGKSRIALSSVRLGITLLLIGAAASPTWKELPTRHTNIDLIAARLRQLGEKDDLIVVHPWEYAVSLSRYYHGPAEVVTLPPIKDHRLHRYDLVLHQMMAADPLSPVLMRMGNVLQSGHRVFLVGYLEFPKPEEVPPTLRPAFQDAGGQWHGGFRAAWQILDDYKTVWQLQAGHFLRSKATRAVKIAVPVPDNARVQEYEDLNLSMFQGWTPTSRNP